MKKACILLIALIIIITGLFSGCTQTETENDLEEEPKQQEEERTKETNFKIYYFDLYFLIGGDNNYCEYGIQNNGSYVAYDISVYITLENTKNIQKMYDSFDILEMKPFETYEGYDSTAKFLDWSFIGKIEIYYNDPDDKTHKQEIWFELEHELVTDEEDEQGMWAVLSRQWYG